MKLKRLLQVGYFPKELPPPFETSSFAEKSGFIKNKWNRLLIREKAPKGTENAKAAERRFHEDYVLTYGSSQLTSFSLAKGVFSRRKLSIPNPKQFLDLSIGFVENWSELREVYGLSPYSQSIPVESDAKRAVRTKSKSWNIFKFGLIEKSFDKKVELRLDVSQFYPSIYTHSIPWGILGKEKAKRYFKIKNTQKAHWTSILSSDKDAQKYRMADFLDMLVRNCNDRQSIGLPIGPDTSFVLAEVIACRIDFEIKEKLKNVNHEGVRYYDDYFFYFNSLDDATSSLKIIQQALYEFQLETNESKVAINEIPFKYTETWALQISNFKFTKIDQYELRNYFSILNNLVEENKSNCSWIVNYALGRFEFGYVKIRQENWELFLNFLLQLLLIDPSNIDQIFKIILSYKIFLTARSKLKIRELLEVLIRDNLSLNHSFEVSWSLWILKSFKIKCSRDVLNEVLLSNDTISKLICLDIIDANLYSGRKPSLSRLALTLSTIDLFNENWLITYEAYKKGWLDFRGRKIVDGHKFMKMLYDFDVSFYNVNNQVKTAFDVVLPTAVAATGDDGNLTMFDDLFNVHSTGPVINLPGNPPSKY